MKQKGERENKTNIHQERQKRNKAVKGDNGIYT